MCGSLYKFLSLKTKHWMVSGALTGTEAPLAQLSRLLEGPCFLTHELSCFGAAFPQVRGEETAVLGLSPGKEASVSQRPGHSLSSGRAQERHRRREGGPCWSSIRGSGPGVGGPEESKRRRAPACFTPTQQPGVSWHEAVRPSQRHSPLTPSWQVGLHYHPSLDLNQAPRCPAA